MACELNPKNKIAYSRFLFSFLISYAILWIFLYFVLSFLPIRIDLISFSIGIILIYILIQLFVHHLDQNQERIASQEDWKSPRIPKNQKCHKIFQIPLIISKIFVKIKGEILEPIFLYASIFDFPIIKKGWNNAVDHPEFNSNKDHDAIIIMSYSRYSREYFTISGLDLILNFFIDKKINYRVCCCDNLSTFLKIIDNPNASSLWILGHGCHGGIRISDTVVKYSDIVKQLSSDAKNKKFVYQFHCNSGCDPSLSDLIANGRGFVNYQKQFPYTLRGYLTNILRDDRWNLEKEKKTTSH